MTDLELIKKGYIEIQITRETDRAVAYKSLARSRTEGPLGVPFIKLNWCPKSVLRYDDVGHIFIPYKYFQD